MPTRWVIDFGDKDQLQAAAFTAAFAHVQATVLKKMQDITARKGQRGEGDTFNEQFLRARLGNWWQFRRACIDTVEAIGKLRRYIACSRHTKRPVFQFLAPGIRPDSAVQVFALEDDYSFGVLQSHAHCLWFITKCGKLTERLRYSAESVFDTFPWPQEPQARQVVAVAEAGREVRRVRTEALAEMTGGLRALYRTLELPGANPLKDAHSALDAAVLAAYGFNAKKDLLAQLLALNLEVADKIEREEPVTAPGVPANYPDARKLVTDDCIHPHPPVSSDEHQRKT
jgi:hypothetical protein